MEAGRSVRELLEKVRVNAAFFWGISGFWVGYGPLVKACNPSISMQDKLFREEFFVRNDFVCSRLVSGNSNGRCSGGVFSQ